MEMPMNNQPSISLDSDTLPDIKDWDIGKEYVVVMRLKQVSSDMSANEKKENCYARFEIKEIGVLDEGGDQKDEKNDANED